MEVRNELFQKLKPPCVALGQAAVALHGPRGDVKTAADELDKVRWILLSATSTTTTALDPKLAEYVFFPIAQLLKVSQKLSINALELCLQCIAILIDKGWRQDIPSSLAAQLVILCSLLAEKKPKGLSFVEATDDLQAWSFWCMYHLFSVILVNHEAANLLRSESNFPQLGQTISIVLDGIHDGGSIEVQVAATNTLHALVTNVMDTEVQAGFLPGIVSKLTRVLTPQTKSRRNYTVLIGNLNTIKSLLRNTMGDKQQGEILNKDVYVTNGVDKSWTKSVIDADWQKSAATQLKPAMSNILRLKSHSREDVKDSVASLCLVMLEHCRTTLGNCSRMALEALVTLAAERPESGAAQDLRVLTQIHSSVGILLQSQLYDWVQSLPTITQGSDEQLKLVNLDQITTGYEILKSTELNIDTIERLLATVLRDCVVVNLTTQASHPASSTFNTTIESLDVQVVDKDMGNSEFSAPLVKYRGQEEFFERIEKLARTISGSTTSFSFADTLLRHLPQSQGETRMSNIWLLLTAAKTILHQKFNVDELLYIQDDSTSTLNEYLEELYSVSLDILSDSSNEYADPRLKSLALQGLALRAQEAGEEFRYELVDALYPVLHTLAAPDSQLQRDSIAALNIFSTACKYASVKQLIVENVDYLTNAVALKLNAFDISPQAPQVLLMMVKLSGPSLLPYLEDTIESIFAALENYHGYPLLVELLFQVLSVVAKEGTRTPQLAIAAGDYHEDIGDRWRPTSMDSLSNELQKRAAQLSKKRASQREFVDGHPQIPWREIGNTEEEKENATAIEDECSDVQMAETDPLPPAPKTYSLLLKIDALTQHFLPSSSTSLRSRLLDLIKTTIPAIAQHENSFLPLINTLWPEIVSRLDDEEHYIVAAALDVISMLCQYAGNFMRTRITQVWPRLKEIYQVTGKSLSNAVSTEKSRAFVSAMQLKQAMQRMQASPATYNDTGATLIWRSLATTLAMIVQWTGPSPEMFDEALEMAEPMLERSEVHLAFERQNPDAVWLCDVRREVIEPPSEPVVSNDRSWKFAIMSR